MKMVHTWLEYFKKLAYQEKSPHILPAEYNNPANYRRKHHLLAKPPEINGFRIVKKKWEIHKIPIFGSPMAVFPYSRRLFT